MMFLDPYNASQPVRISPERKKLDYLSLQKFLSECPELVKAYFTAAPHNSNHEALMIETLTLIDGKRYPINVYLVTSADYPYEEPQAFTMDSEVGQLVQQDVDVHTYILKDAQGKPMKEHPLFGRALCVKLRGGWNPNKTFGLYYYSLISPWIANYACFRHYGPELWPRKEWTTLTERQRP